MPHLAGFGDRLRRHGEQLGHVRWRLWNGNLDGDDWALLWLRASIDEHLFMAQVTEPETRSWDSVRCLNQRGVDMV